MKREKLFGIGAVVLLVLVAFAPAINGVQLNNVLDDPENNVSNMGDSYDLAVEITNGPDFVEYEINELTEVVYAIYWIEYDIINKGTEIYIGTPITAVNIEVMEWVDWWEENDNGKDIEIEPNGGYLSRSHDIKVFCSDNPNEDLERYFADHKVYLECGLASGNDIYPIDNVMCKRAVQFYDDAYLYNEDENVIETLGQVLVTTPWRKETRNETIMVNDATNGTTYEETFSLPEITKIYEEDNIIGDLLCKGLTLDELLADEEVQENITYYSNLNFNNWEEINETFEGFIIWLKKVLDRFFEEIPNLRRNNRLGWLLNATRYTIALSLELILLVGIGIACTVELAASTALHGILTWLNSVIALLSLFGTGLVTWDMILAVFGLNQLALIVSYATQLLIILFTCGGLAIMLIKAILYDLERWEEWFGRAPWTDEIMVHGKVFFAQDKETITVTCRKTSEPFIVEGDPNQEFNPVNYSLYVPSQIYDPPEWKELVNFTAKPCVSYADGDSKKYKRPTAKSHKLKIFSYCFPGGKVYKNIIDFRWTQPTSRNINNRPGLLEFLNILKNKFENRPIVKLLLNSYFLFFK